jgi:hypothetical protein
MTARAALGPQTTGKPPTTAASDGQPTLQVNNRLRACAQVTQSPGLSLVRRKPGVQIPSPPPPKPAGQSVVSFERAALTARCGRTAAASASPSPAGKALSDHATRPGPPMMTTEGSRRFQPELRVARQAGLEGHCGSGRWSSRSRDTAGRPGRALLACGCPPHSTHSTSHGRRHSGRGTPGHRHRTPDTGHRTCGHDRLCGQGA